MVLIFLTLTIQSPVSPTDIGGAEGSLFLVGVFPLLNNYASSKKQDNGSGNGSGDVRSVFQRYVPGRSLDIRPVRLNRC